MKIAKNDKTRINEDITAPKVRLIGSNSEQIGVVGIMEAQQIALEQELDLVEIAPEADPPVCRIMDFGKFLYSESKKKHAAKKKQKQIQIKEIKFRPRTDDGDYQVKLKNLQRFIENGDKIKVTLRFRGREFVHQELGMSLLKRVESDLGEIATVEQFPKMEGRQMIMVMAPKK